jgi:hypothetical protein
MYLLCPRKTHNGPSPPELKASISPSINEPTRGDSHAETEISRIGDCLRIGIITGLFDRKSDYRTRTIACLFYERVERQQASRHKFRLSYSLRYLFSKLREPVIPQKSEEQQKSPKPKAYSRRGGLRRAERQPQVV